ncbi:MAG: DUF1731 domain-containing protein [Desulfobacterales bacterium]
MMSDPVKKIRTENQGQEVDKPELERTREGQSVEISVGKETREAIEGAEIPSGEISESERKSKEGYDGGALEKMILPIRFFVGGPIGSGKQWFPWIHIEDLTSAIMFILENRAIIGPLNFTAPKPARNIELVKTIAAILHRPALMPAPSFMIRLVLGEFGASILASQRAVPDKLLKYGFNFKYPDIKSAVSNII